MDCVNDSLLYVKYRLYARSTYFGPDGRYLGDVDDPEGVDVLLTHPFIDGRRVIAVYQDDAGTIMVKRYRLVLPGEKEL